MLRVLTLSTLFPDAGRPNFGIFVERQTLGLAALDDVEVTVVAPVGIPPKPLCWHPHYRTMRSLPAREQWKGLDVHRPHFPHVPIFATRFAPWLMFRALLPVLRTIRAAFPFDIIDAEFFWPDGPAAVALGKALGVPVSIKARGSDIHYWGEKRASRAQIVQVGNAADGILAVSAALKRDMIAFGMPEHAIGVHYTGVDLNRFGLVERSAAKRALGVEGPLIVTVGYLIERKGQQLVVDAIRYIPEATLFIVGDGPLRPTLETQIAEAGIGDRVRLMGSMPHDTLPGLFAAADISVLPSASEGLANVWVESIACGTPVVICDVGGAREIVDRPAAGRIVTRTPGEIAAAIQGLLADPPGQADTRRAAERFTWDANARALHTHLAGLVERHKRGNDPAILSA